MFKDLVLKNRSYRRFYQEQPGPKKILKELVDMARLTPSAANLQPLKYLVYNDSKKNADIFTFLNWAGYLKDWPGPEEGERPAAYIIILGDQLISKTINWDHGIAAQTIMLGAVEKDLGGCIIASFDKEKLHNILFLLPHLEILLVLALGKPKEVVKLEKVSKNDIKYWRDKNLVHHVPKRTLNEVLLNS
jgi:nitroreductase